MLKSLFVLLAAAVYATALTVTPPRLTVDAKNRTRLRQQSLDIDTKLTSLVRLKPTDTLKLTWTVLEGETPVQPHQTFLRFYDEQSGEEGIQPVKVASDGKAQFTLDMSDPPASLPPTTQDVPLSVSLILGSFVHPPARYELFNLLVPPSSSAPSHPDEPSFHTKPEIQHTFRPDHVLPARPISAFFALSLIGAPWFLLVTLWAKIGMKTPNLLSGNIVPFTALLGAFEALLVWYWVGLKLGEVLTYGAILSVPTIFFGRRALYTIGQSRLGSVKK